MECGVIVAVLTDDGAAAGSRQSALAQGHGANKWYLLARSSV